VPYRKTILSVLFFLFLFPFSIEVDGAGISANYAYIFLPIFALLTTGKLKMPDRNTWLLMLLYSLILIAALSYQSAYIEFFTRRIISFILFMSLFSYCFIGIDSEMTDSFKNAVIMIALYFSITTILRYAALGGEELGFYAKGAVGSQRFGFVYIMAIWLLYHSRISLAARNVFLVVVSIGLLLTFSRSAIVALIGSGGLFAGYNILKWIKRPKTKMAVQGALFILGLAALVLLLNKNFPVVFDFFNQRLFSHLTKEGASTINLNDETDSEGYRLFMVRTVLDFVLSNPLNGSGYLGVWILFPDHQGSAHNQYLDVLFRTGILGFLGYMFLIYRILKHLYSGDPGLFWGTTGILIYGLFHETFKLSQGAFILSFLLGIARSRYASNHAARQNVVPPLKL
jgi:O-antigen ligase